MEVLQNREKKFMKVIFLDTKVHLMKESNILVHNVTKNLRIRVILPNTEKQFMK